LFKELTSIINSKSISILDFLCKQYPQTKIEAPNITLRELLPQIDNQGRIKFDLVSLVSISGVEFTYQNVTEYDYTPQIMRLINYAIDKTNEEYD
jgi:uroporphyrinogen-III synthase